jgi:hypothetical protein
MMETTERQGERERERGKEYVRKRVSVFLMTPFVLLSIRKSNIFWSLIFFKLIRKWYKSQDI